MTAPRNMVQLPLSGDLWMPPTFDEQGNITPREDTVNVKDLPPVNSKMSPDVAALLMAENARLAAEKAKTE